MEFRRVLFRSHSAEGIGLAIARDGQGRSEAHRALLDEDPEESTATCVANGLRNARCAAKEEGVDVERRPGRESQLAWILIQETRRLRALLLPDISPLPAPPCSRNQRR